MASKKKKTKGGKQPLPKKTPAAARVKSRPVHPEVWENLTISLHFGWEACEHMLAPAKKPPASFKLIPFEQLDEAGNKVRRLRVKVLKDSMKSAWSRVVFDFCGSEKVVPPCPLLDEFEDTDEGRGLYVERLKPVSNELQKADTALERIEGIYEIIRKLDDGTIERVPVTFKVTYVPKCVGSDDGVLSDLVVFYADIPGGPQPDGGGTGPPKRND